MYVQHCKHLQFQCLLPYNYKLVPNWWGVFMQVAICPFEKLRVVIVLDHAIRKECLARITATAARTSSIESATLQ